MLIIAHRGAKGYVSENSIPAFQKALEMGVGGVELDVHLSADGEIFVFHDENTQRLTSHIGTIAEMAASEIRQLRIEKLYQIPSLKEVIDLINKKCMINVELKTKSAALPVLAMVENYVSARGWNYSQFILSSFDWIALQQIRELNSEIPLGVLTETNLELATAFAKFINAETIHAHFHLLTGANVNAMQQQGLGVFAWTVNIAEDIEKIKSFGVDGIITDYPDKI